MEKDLFILPANPLVLRKEDDKTLRRHDIKSTNES